MILFVPFSCFLLLCGKGFEIFHAFSIKQVSKSLLILKSDACATNEIVFSKTLNCKFNKEAEGIYMNTHPDYRVLRAKMLKRLKVYDTAILSTCL